MSIPTMKVKAWGEGQGDHVVINEEDFDPKVHTPFEDGVAAKPAKAKRKAKK